MSKQRLGEAEGSSLTYPAQGSGGVPIPGGVQTPSGCGPWGQGWAGMGVLGWRLDLVTSEVFPNLSDSVILRHSHLRPAPCTHPQSKRYPALFFFQRSFQTGS